MGKNVIPRENKQDSPIENDFGDGIENIDENDNEINEFPTFGNSI
jgi:hypothetical protein